MIPLWLDVVMFSAIAVLCWQGYRDHRIWLGLLGYLIARLYQGRSFTFQLFTLGPILVGWLLLCHWLSGKGAQGLAAGGILLAMTLALDAMRNLEERQKQEREP